MVNRVGVTVFASREHSKRTFGAAGERMTVGLDRGRSKGAALALALACLWAATSDAAANTRACRQLEAELASVGGGGSSKYKKYDAAVARQRDQLDIARRQARRAGCGFSFFGGASECGGINAQIDRMERNLQALERKRRELSGNVDPRRERARILAALEAQGCRDGNRPRGVVVTRDGGTRSLFDQLFGGGAVRRGLPIDEVMPPDGEADTRLSRVLSPDGRIAISGPPGQFRTLCVRTCDGYFFPMSSASSSIDFDRDQKNCESACPGTEMQLYYHLADGEESDAMVAAGSNEPYSALPTAFLYKSASYSRPRQCGCSAPKNFEIVAGEPPSASPAAPVEAADHVPVPSPRPDAGADPETIADAEAGMTAEAIAKLLAKKPETTSAIGKAEPGERRIRVVGPVFLPDPEGAIDLQAPAPKTTR